TEAGVMASVRAFAEKSGIPAVLYIKNEGYITPAGAAELVSDGIISWIKYAIVRENPAEDPFLSELVQLVDPRMIVSGIGEQPAPVHLLDFGVGGFTSGCVCVQPALSAQMLTALKAGDRAAAEALRVQFCPLEDLRNAHGPIPVLHHAVEGAGIAKTGPHLPLLGPLEDSLVAEISQTASALRSASAGA
ncbi:MAG: dihydrodipicolinate synthase/N-acetylneuraminate lyase, partial [Verrucomicrobiales bacterium]